MSRLIDTDKLKNHYAWWEIGDGEITYAEAKKRFDTIIDVQPTVDAVPLEDYQSMERTVNKLRMALADAEPVIRCKNCEYAEHWYGDKARCFLWSESGIDVFEDGYCNYGKRREDETN